MESLFEFVWEGQGTGGGLSWSWCEQRRMGINDGDAVVDASLGRSLIAPCPMEHDPVTRPVEQWITSEIGVRVPSRGCSYSDRDDPVRLERDET